MDWYKGKAGISFQKRVDKKDERVYYKDIREKKET